ncbi:K+ channel tetramerization domain protein [Oesophagostomum dentatum]|uniref:K+ channel tetramerization domain protein n=1 Tax=Oesophagostomum dentatum TaxID=61180 RepID=A0A0B1S276_OESDE|nr:K+ channel tetramerization domain protein [Oesophagostomum dentatum]
MSRGRHADDILNINVGGKKYTVRRTDMLADPRSKLAEWFKPGTVKPIATDKGGNYYLDRDAKTFRHILAYLRLKKEKFVPSLALPSKPDDLAKWVTVSISCALFSSFCYTPYRFRLFSSIFLESPRATKKKKSLWYHS